MRNPISPREPSISSQDGRRMVAREGSKVRHRMVALTRSRMAIITTRCRILVEDQRRRLKMQAQQEVLSMQRAVRVRDMHFHRLMFHMREVVVLIQAELMYRQARYNRAREPQMVTTSKWLSDCAHLCKEKNMETSSSQLCKLAQKIGQSA